MEHATDATTKRDGCLTVLLPARNAEQLLPDWLASVSAYADAVIALDDGSTDDTRQLLDDHPLVERVLTNPVRSSYQGWDDLENRQRLIDVALATDASWLLFLDADERLDPDDGRALRTFLAAEAQPGFAYGFEVFRMAEDDRHYDPRGMWVFRLFSAVDARASRLGSQRLHFVPVPTAIPSRHWLFTSLRIQHFGSLTEHHRRQRFEKYREADPGNECQDDYTGLLSDPVSTARWPARASTVPVLLGREGRYVDRLDEAERLASPAVTAVVIAQNDVDVIDRSLRALVEQDAPDEMEVVLVCSGDDATFQRAVTTFPTVRSLQLPRRALPGEARNAGLWMARGEYVTFPGSHVWLLPGSLGARFRAHEEGWDLVTGAVVNGNRSRAGWASYFVDHSTQTPARPSGEFHGAPGHASYVRQDLRDIGGFPEHMRAGEDTVVNQRLYFAGKRTFFCAEAAFVHASPSTSFRQLFRHHLQRGRAMGQIIRARGPRIDAKQLRSAWQLPRHRLRTIAAAMRDSDDDLRARYREVRPAVTGAVLAAAAGTWWELLRPRPPRPVADAAVADDHGTGPVLAIGGRPGEARFGLLAAGTPAQAAARLVTFTRYARAVCPVRPALAPIVTSATISAEHTGTYTIDLPRPAVDGYLAAARDMGAALLLQVQPGAASLVALVDRWEELLVEPDVGMLLDLRPEVAFPDAPDDLEAMVDRLHELGPALVLVRGRDVGIPGVTTVPDALDLRRPGTPYPHDALLATPRPDVLLYQ